MSTPSRLFAILNHKPWHTFEATSVVHHICHQSTKQSLYWYFPIYDDQFKVVVSIMRSTKIHLILTKVIPGSKPSGYSWNMISTHKLTLSSLLCHGILLSTLANIKACWAYRIYQIEPTTKYFEFRVVWSEFSLPTNLWEKIDYLDIKI